MTGGGYTRSEAWELQLQHQEPFCRLSAEDLAQARSILGKLRAPDLIIAPDDGKPYLYRWYVIPRREVGANVYFHIQVASDPERPLHDHPWDNQSVLLSGYYDEIIGHKNPSRSTHFAPWQPFVTTTERRMTGGVYTRPAEQPHRLLLPPGVPYTMTMFTTGPVRRTWGFWITEEKWCEFDQCVTHLPDGRSIWTYKEETADGQERDRQRGS